MQTIILILNHILTMSPTTTKDGVLKANNRLKGYRTVLTFIYKQIGNLYQSLMVVMVTVITMMTIMIMMMI